MAPLWLNTENKVIPPPNELYLYNNGLTPVTWTKNVKYGQEMKMRNLLGITYTLASEGDTKESMWANAQNGDGSFLSGFQDLPTELPIIMCKATQHQQVIMMEMGCGKQKMAV